MGLFNKKNELEQLQGQQGELQQEINALQGKINKISNALELAETESMIEGTQTAQKKATKFKKALEGFQKQQADLTKNAEEINSQITKHNEEKRQIDIENTLKEHYENTKRKNVYSHLYIELGRLHNLIDTRAHSSIGYPKALREMAGLKHGRPMQPEQGEFFTKTRETEAKAREDAEKEALEIIANLKSFMEIN